MNEKRKFISLFSLFLVLIIILSIMLGLSNSHNPTSTRYIKREKDEIKAYYSSLYFDATGEGSGIAIEDNVGYVSLDLKNYIDDNITKRDIEYKIETVTQYYNQQGEVLENPDGNQDLYVLDLWKQPTKIENDTCKYKINIESNSGEQASSGNYLFKYEERGTSAIGKTHKVTLKVARKETFDPIVNNERISIVVEIIKPYKTIYIINMYVTNRLILFADMNTELFDTQFKSLQIQTANVFAYTKENVPMKTSKAFKVTLSWKHLILNENMLKTIHNNVLDLLGTTNADNLDISKPYIVDINQVTDSGTLTIYVPQCSNFNLNFLPTANDFEVEAKVEIWCDAKSNVGDSESKAGYMDYTLTDFNGYELDAEGKMVVMKGTN